MHPAIRVKSAQQRTPSVAKDHAALHKSLHNVATNKTNVSCNTELPSPGRLLGIYGPLWPIYIHYMGPFWPFLHMAICIPLLRPVEQSQRGPLSQSPAKLDAARRSLVDSIEPGTSWLASETTPKPYLLIDFNSAKCHPFSSLKSPTNLDGKSWWRITQAKTAHKMPGQSWTGRQTPPQPKRRLEWPLNKTRSTTWHQSVFNIFNKTWWLDVPVGRRVCSRHIHLLNPAYTSYTLQTPFMSQEMFEREKM